MENEVRNNRQESRFELDLEGGGTAYFEYEEAGEGVLAGVDRRAAGAAPASARRGRAACA